MEQFETPEAPRLQRLSYLGWQYCNALAGGKLVHYRRQAWKVREFLRELEAAQKIPDLS